MTILGFFNVVTDILYTGLTILKDLIEFRHLQEIDF